MYVMYLGFVPFCISRTSRTSLDNRGLTSSLLSPKYSISVCPKDGNKKMTIFLYFKISPSRFSIRISLSVLSCFYKPHLTSVHHVRKIQDCLVKNSDVSNDAHSLTNPWGASIQNSVIYCMAGLTSIFKVRWPPGFPGISFFFLF